jgi:hypothetical protein
MAQFIVLRIEWVGGCPALCVLVQAFDVVLQTLPIDTPDATSTDLDGRKVA